MNKIYSEPIDKVKILVEAVEKQKELLKSKGISIDTSGLSEACRLLEDAGKKQEEENNGNQSSQIQNRRILFPALRLWWRRRGRGLSVP